jgi:HEAT repeat protein
LGEAINWGQWILGGSVMPIEWKAIAKAKMANLMPMAAAQVIRAVLSSGSEYEPWLHRDLLLAGWCLTEAPPELKTVAPDLVGEILDRLVAIAGDNRFQCGRHVRQQVKQILCGLDAATFGMEVLDRLKALGSAIPPSDLNEHQIRLGERESGSAALSRLLLDEGMLLDRLAAIAAWVKLSQEKMVTGNPLLTILETKDSPIRAEAIQALGELGDTSPEAVNALFAVFEGKPSSHMHDATQALIQLGQFEPSILDRLLKLAEHSNWRIRRYIANWSFEPQKVIPESIIKTLIGLSHDEHRIVRSSAASSLGNFVNDSPEITPQLLALTNDSEEDVQTYAIYALGKLNCAPPEVIEQLMRLSIDPNQRGCIAYVLGDIGNGNDSIISWLLKLVQDEDPHTTHAAIESLVRLNVATPNVVATILTVLDHDAIWLRSSAASALGQLGNTSPNTIRALTDRLHQNDATFTRCAAEALIQLGHGSMAIAAEIVAFLDHESFSWRERYADELGPIGKQSEEIPYLLKQWLEKHPENEAVRDAIDALWSIVVE